MAASTGSFHVNPVSGDVGRCRAKTSCPFGSRDSHFATQEEALKAYEAFAQALADPKQTARFHFTTEVEQEDFTSGDCAHLAKKLAEKTGYPLVIFAPDEGDLPIDEVMWDHMAVETPDGRILDVEGLWTKEDFTKRWARTRYYAQVGSRFYGVLLKDFKLAQEDTPWYDSSPTKTAKRILDVVLPAKA